MIGMNYLFWNTHKNIDINPILRDLITENCISIVVLAEYTADINDLIRLLYDSGVIMEHIPTVGCDRIHILGRIDFHIEPQLQTDYASIQVIGRDTILEQLPEDTQNIIWGRIVAYDGHVTSYTSIKTSLAEAIGTITTEKRIDIQDSLGKCGEEEKKFECFLYTSGYEKYRYRMFFMKYGTAHYPVQFTLEESIAENIGLNGKYIQICNSRNEVEDLIVKILTSKKVLRVMQELIRIHQAKSSNNIPDSLHDGTSNAE